MSFAFERLDHGPGTSGRWAGVTVRAFFVVAFRLVSNFRPPRVYPPITNSSERLSRILRHAPDRAPGS